MRYRCKKDDSEDNILNYLHLNRFRVADLAKKVGYSRAGVYDIFAGRSRNPDRETVAQLARILRMKFGFDHEGLWFEEWGFEGFEDYEGIYQADDLPPGLQKLMENERLCRHFNLTERDINAPANLHLLSQLWNQEQWLELVLLVKRFTTPVSGAGKS